MKWFKCCKCGEEKQEDNFYKDKSKPSGFKPRCKPCDSMSRDKAKRAIYEKEYWDKRREERRKIILESYNNNSEKHKKKRREYLDSANGNANHRKHSQTRRARERNAFVEVVNPKEKYDFQNGVCYICENKFSFSDMECDHVIPLAKGGLHEGKNIKMACIHCNRSKGAKVLKEVCYQMV